MARVLEDEDAGNAMQELSEMRDDLKSSRGEGGAPASKFRILGTEDC